jgi:hypothetical protein
VRVLKLSSDQIVKIERGHVLHSAEHTVGMQINFFMKKTVSFLFNVCWEPGRPRSLDTRSDHQMVIRTEFSKPDLSCNDDSQWVPCPCRYDGHLLAKELAALGVQTTAITDAAVFAMMARVNMVRGQLLSGLGYPHPLRSAFRFSALLHSFGLIDYRFV